LGFSLILDLSGPKKQLPEPRLPSWGRVRTAAFNSPFAPLARVFQRRIEIISLSRPDILCFHYMKSRSNWKAPTRQLASQVDKLNRLTRLYLDLGLRSQHALQAAKADLKQMASDLFHQANEGSLALVSRG